MRWIVNNNVPVWPVQGPSIPPAYHRCEEVLVAPPSITMALLDAFASVGLTITQPPQEVYDLVHEIQCHQLLTPELAHATILVRCNDFCTNIFFTDKYLPNAEVGVI